MSGLKVFVLFAVLAAVSAGSYKRLRTRGNRFGIDGGTDAQQGEVPFVASVQWCLFNIVCEHVCGGVILNENWILTAAECVDDASTVVVGAAQLHEEYDSKQTIEVDKSYVHPDYDYDDFPNDIALLKLKSSIVFDDSNVQAATLPAQGANVSGTVSLAGYGESLLPNWNRLQIINDLPIISNDDCNQAIDDLFEDPTENPLDENSNICAGDLTKGANNCDGDAGSPLFQDKTVVGLGTWIITPCALQGAPNVYTNVANFADWIQQTISDNS